MTLDGHSCDGQRFDAVRIDSSLGKEFHVLYLMCFFIEYINETLTDDLALAFRFGYTFQFVEEFLACIHSDDIQSQAFVIVHYILEFVLAEHSMIHKDAGKVFADGFIEQNGCDGGIDSAA